MSWCPQGVLESANFPIDQLPMLDVIQTVTEPILTKLRFHFATGRPTDRIDQPDWLFQTAANLTKEHYEDFKLLQSAVEAHGLGQIFFLPWEFANAMRAAVQTLLKEHVLPRLAQQVSECYAFCGSHLVQRACAASDDTAGQHSSTSRAQQAHI